MFSPVTDLTSKYFNITFMDVNWLSLVYLVASIPSGFIASWMLDTFGLRASVSCLFRNLEIVSFFFSYFLQGQIQGYIQILNFDVFPSFRVEQIFISVQNINSHSSYNVVPLKYVCLVHGHIGIFSPHVFPLT